MAIISPHLLLRFVIITLQPRGSTNITKEIDGFKAKYDVILKIQRDAMQLDAVPDQRKPKGMKGETLRP